MTLEYDRIAAEINKICDSCCWHTPRPDCPFYSVCTDPAFDVISDERERTEAFETALVNRFHELQNMKGGTNA